MGDKKKKVIFLFVSRKFKHCHTSCFLLECSKTKKCFSPNSTTLQWDDHLSWFAVLAVKAPHPRKSLSLGKLGWFVILIYNQPGAVNSQPSSHRGLKDHSSDLILEATSELRRPCWVSALPHSILPQLAIVPSLLPRGHALQGLQFWEPCWQFGSALFPPGRGLAFIGHLPRDRTQGLPSCGL